jgi:hypothetical protein
MFEPKRASESPSGLSFAEKAQQRDVQTVEPDDRLLAEVAVVVPSPGGRDDEVAAAHRRALAIDRRVRALAVEHEAQRGLGVAVRRGHFAG